MYNRFNLNAERAIKGCNFQSFRQPILHPDRTADSFHDILYMIEGEWGIGQEDEVFVLKSDHVIILPSGLHHYPVSPSTQYMSLIYLDITVDEKDCVFREAAEDSLPTLIDCRNNPQIRKLFEDICIFDSAPNPRRNIIIASMLRLLLCRLHDAVHPTPDSDKTIYKAVKIIKQNPTVFYSEAQLAELTGVGIRTIRQRFMDYFGKSPRAYQMDEKLAQVREVLTERPELSLRELADNFGFCDEYYLNHCFRKKYGIPPGRYRGKSIK